MTDETREKLDELDEALETPTSPTGPLPPEVLERQGEEIEPYVENTDLVMHPLTGEAIDLVHAPDDLLARFLSDIKNDERALKEARGTVEGETLRRMDMNGEWTLRAGGYTLQSSSPEPSEEWDELALRDALLDLSEQGVISIEAVDRAIETVVTYKARKQGINKLRKLGGRVAETIEQHTFRVPKRRYVRVQDSSR